MTLLPPLTVGLLFAYSLVLVALEVRTPPR